MDIFDFRVPVRRRFRRVSFSVVGDTEVEMELIEIGITGWRKYRMSNGAIWQTMPSYVTFECTHNWIHLTFDPFFFEVCFHCLEAREFRAN